MRWRLPAARGPGDHGNAELDARLSGTWAAAAAAAGASLDIPAGRDALLASSVLVADETAGLRAPAGPARRHRQLAQALAGGAVAVLAVCAVALLAGGAPATRHDSGGHVSTTADLVQRVDKALSAAEPGQIAQMTVTSSGSAGQVTAEEWSYGDRWRSVTDSPAGHQDYAESFRSPASFTLVSYPARAWARQQISSAPPRTLGPRGCQQAVTAFPLLLSAGLAGVGMTAGSLPTTVARDLRAAISCGTLVVAGRQDVGGRVKAIKLTSRPGSPIAETIWVSPGSYLPVRVTAASPIGNHVLRQTATISWLPPTPRNLAKLAVPVPDGFRRVPLGLLLRRISGTLAQKVRTAP